MTTKTDDHIDAALAKHPWTDRPSEKYPQHLAKANGRRTSREWAEGMSAAARRAAAAAWHMVRDCGSAREWAERVSAAARRAGS